MFQKAKHGHLKHGLFCLSQPFCFFNHGVLFSFFQFSSVGWSTGARAKSGLGYKWSGTKMVWAKSGLAKSGKMRGAAGGLGQKWFLIG